MFKNKSILTLLAVLLICNTTSPQWNKGFNANKAAGIAKGVAGLAALTSGIVAAAMPNDPKAQQAYAAINAGNEVLNQVI